MEVIEVLSQFSEKVQSFLEIHGWLVFLPAAPTLRYSTLRTGRPDGTARFRMGGDEGVFYISGFSAETNFTEVVLMEQAADLVAKFVMV